MAMTNAIVKHETMNESPGWVIQHRQRRLMNLPFNYRQIRNVACRLVLSSTVNILEFPASVANFYRNRFVWTQSVFTLNHEPFIFFKGAILSRPTYAMFIYSRAYWFREIYWKQIVVRSPSNVIARITEFNRMSRKYDRECKGTKHYYKCSTHNFYDSWT